MEVAELRIGNWFNVKPIHNRNELTPIKIKDIHQRHCDNEYSINGFVWGSGDWVAYNLEDLQPVTLTAEILLKCGFKEVDDTYIYHIDEFMSIVWFKDTKQFNYNIQHLHELQNLIFALTKEQLKIEL